MKKKTHNHEVKIKLQLALFTVVETNFYSVVKQMPLKHLINYKLKCINYCRCIIYNYEVTIALVALRLVYSIVYDCAHWSIEMLAHGFHNRSM